MLKLYEIADQYKALLSLDDPEVPEEAIKDTLEALEGEMQIKGASVAACLQNLASEAEAIKQAEQRMKGRREFIERRVESIRQYLQSNMERSGITELKTPELIIKLRKNPGRVEIDCQAALPSKFVATKTETVIDKKGILQAIRNGEEVPGAHLEQSMRLEIR